MWPIKRKRVPTWTCRPLPRANEPTVPWHELLGDTVRLQPVTDSRSLSDLMDSYVIEGQGFTGDAERDAEWAMQQSPPKYGLSFDFAIADYRTSEPLGWISLACTDGTSVTMGYWMGAKGRGQGHTTEAAILVTKFALGHLGMSAIYAEAARENVASIRVAQHAGLEIVGPSTNTRPNGKTFECFTLCRNDGPTPGATLCQPVAQFREALVQLGQPRT